MKYDITVGDGRSTEELVAEANYVYSHSQVSSDNFPTGLFTGEMSREIVMLSFGHPVSSEEITAEAAKQGLDRPYLLRFPLFGVKCPDVQLDGSVAFLHDSWLGNCGRRDTMCHWNNAGRR